MSSSSNVGNEQNELLLALSASCQKHKEQHHSKDTSDPNGATDQHSHVRDSQADQERGWQPHGIEASDSKAIPPKCRSSLETLQQLLKRVDEIYSPEMSPHSSHVINLCDFFLSVISGSFCPHFRRLFRCDESHNDCKYWRFRFLRG